MNITLISDNSNYTLPEQSLSQFSNSVFYKVIVQNNQNINITEIENNKYFVNADDDCLKLMVSFMRGYPLGNELETNDKLIYDMNRFKLLSSQPEPMYVEMNGPMQMPNILNSLLGQLSGLDVTENKYEQQSDTSPNISDNDQYNVISPVASAEVSPVPSPVSSPDYLELQF